MGPNLSVRPWDDGIIVAVSGEVDACTEGPLQQVLLRIMRERSSKIFLDVSEVSFMDCGGLRALLATRRRTELCGGWMRLIATSAAVRRIIELTGAYEALAVEREARPGQPDHRGPACPGRAPRGYLEHGTRPVQESLWGSTTRLHLADRC